MNTIKTMQGAQTRSQTTIWLTSARLDKRIIAYLLNETLLAKSAQIKHILVRFKAYLSPNLRAKLDENIGNWATFAKLNVGIEETSQWVLLGPTKRITD